MGCDRNLLTVRAVFNQSACLDELTVPRLQWTFGWPHTSVAPRGTRTLTPEQTYTREAGIDGLEVATVNRRLMYNSRTLAFTSIVSR